jgi:hypothetical protein
MLLPRSQEDLGIILKYLMRDKGMPVELGGVSAVWSQDNDNMNLRDPRLFCSTEPGSTVISCSRALEDVPREVRVGVLVHEVGHIMLGAFENSDSEVDVDAWVASTLPPGSYFYLNAVKYTNSLVEDYTEARAVECVTAAFLKLMDSVR